MNRKAFTILVFFLLPVMLWGQINFSLPPNAGAAAITYAEYFFDTDPGRGSASPFSFTTSTDAAISQSISINGLGNGLHRLYIRTLDANGSWSLVNEQNFFIVSQVIIPASQPAANITQAEYAIDNDPGFGNATPLAVTPSTDITLSGAGIDLTGLAAGVHRIYVRTMDAAGSWGQTNVQSFLILSAGVTIPANPVAANITGMEYFIDSDPGFGQGTAVAVSPATDVTVSDIPISIGSLSNGVHHFYVRTKDAAGSWSLTNTQSFAIVVYTIILPPNPAPGNITSLEYFFDTDPGFGNGKKITVPIGTDLNNFSFAADLTGLNDATHTLYVRTYDDWSMTTVRNFTMGASLPVTWLSFTARLQSDSVVLNWQTASEQNNVGYDIERSADGNVFTSIGAVNGSGSSTQTHAYRFADGKPLSGVSYYRLKQTDADGHFTYSVVISVRIALPSSVTVYPNPASDWVTVAFDKIQPAGSELRLFGPGGQLVQSVAIGGRQQQQLGTAQLPAGMYQLEILSNNTLVIKKIVISH